MKMIDHEGEELLDLGDGTVRNDHLRRRLLQRGSERPGVRRVQPGWTIFP